MPLRKKKESKKSASDLRGSNADMNGGEFSDEEHPWVGVQRRVYTNWINDKLKNFDMQVGSLAKELGDGLVLIKLLETLSGKKIPGK